METELGVADSTPIGSKLTAGQRWMIIGLLVLQIPSSPIFYPLATVFAITGIFVPWSSWVLERCRFHSP